jgi:hypothetical protein
MGESGATYSAVHDEMHRMSGVVAASNNSSMTDTEKLKATVAVAGSMLAVAKLGLAAMQQSKNALHWDGRRDGVVQ